MHTFHRAGKIPNTLGSTNDAHSFDVKLVDHSSDNRGPYFTAQPLVDRLRMLVSWPKLRLLSIVAAVFINSSAVMAGGESEFEFSSDHWVGKSEESSTGKFESCMIAEHNSNGELLILRLDINDILTLGIFEKRWKGKLFIPIPVIVMVDHKIISFHKGMLFADDAMGFELENHSHDLRSIADGQLLSVTLLDENTVFDLTGSKAAVDYLRNCVGHGLLNPV